MSALVSPSAGEEEEVARMLLAHAGDDVHLVQSTMDGPNGLAFIVPDHIAQKYLDERYPVYDEGKAPEDEESNEDSETEEKPAPVKRRGRPPGSKNKVTDNGKDKE
jgi:hypothetical protein